MSKSRADIIRMALRRIGVLSSDIAADADQGSFVGDVLDTLFAELKSVHGLSASWVLEATPDEGFLPLSYLLATEIAPHYEVNSEPRYRAMARLRAYMHPDDSPLRSDLDDDGTVDTAENDIDLASRYY